MNIQTSLLFLFLGVAVFNVNETPGHFTGQPDSPSSRARNGLDGIHSMQGNGYGVGNTATTKNKHV